jgi:predicted glycoside hydrolase/deacetylase ChbG (UPF0249 family)
MRRLVVNADDFGCSDGVNRGVARGHAEGIVTSASLMVRRPWADDAVVMARAHPRLSVGLHLDLGEWVHRGGEWRLERAVVDTEDAGAVAAEIAAQLRAFRELTGRDPTHLDSHQHVHRSEPVLGAARSAARELGIPLRDDGAARYCGDFYGQGRHGAPLPEAITAEALVRIVRALPEGLTELCCHPAAAPETGSDYAEERVLELAALCDPRVRVALGEAVHLCSRRST